MILDLIVILTHSQIKKRVNNNHQNQNRNYPPNKNYPNKNYPNKKYHKPSHQFEGMRNVGNNRNTGGGDNGDQINNSYRRSTSESYVPPDKIFRTDVIQKFRMILIILLKYTALTKTTADRG